MFSKETFRFLTELKSRNERPWFEANKGRYERAVKQPTVELLEVLSDRLRSVSRYVVVDPRPVGGSMMRIYRDVRFSKDKTPYRTHVGAMLRHSKGKGASAPGYYLHVEPGGTMFGGGVWHPEPKALKGIRDRIVKDEKEWRALCASLRKQGYETIGEALKRPPPGYAADDPLIEDIKRKDFCVTMRFKDSEALSPRFTDSLVATARQMGPFMTFLAKATGVPF